MITLATILTAQRERIAVAQHEVPQELLMSRIAVRAKPPRDFVKAITTATPIGIIAEVKFASPSLGVIDNTRTLEQVARSYEDGGATALSILTEPKFFQGDNSYIRRAKVETQLPVLRKDFIISPYQVYESRTLEADAILLIAAAVTAEELKQLTDLAHKLEMQVLIEVHTESEIAAAVACNPDIIGSNNRNLQTMQVDTTTFARIATHVPKTIPLVAESGLTTANAVQAAQQAGAKAVLIGTALMQAVDPVTTLKQLRTYDQS